ncbi:MAG: hypothetical protein R2873_30855 [Caldilineaceae bacterium]
MSNTPDAAKTTQIFSGEQNETPQDGRIPLRYDELWQSSLFRPLLITLLVGCIDVAMVGFLRHILAGMPITHGQLLIFLGVGSAAVGSYHHQLLIRPDQLTDAPSPTAPPNWPSSSSSPAPCCGQSSTAGPRSTRSSTNRWVRCSAAATLCRSS